MIQGSIVALITPFLENEALDIESFKRLIHFQIEQGTKGLVIGGSTGESAALSSQELDLLISVAVKEARGRIPIIAGVGTNNTRLSAQKAQKAKDLGADACLAIFPYYNRPEFRGCLAHFKEIASSKLPLIIYYHPGRTGITLSMIELAEICSLPNVIGLKDCSGKPLQALEVQNLCKKSLFSGDDGLTLPFIEGGAQGVIGVIGNLFPKQWNEVVEAALLGEIEKARGLYATLEPLCEALSLETNPHCIKYAMSLMGHSKPILRLPLVLPKNDVRKRLEEEILSLKSSSFV